MLRKPIGASRIASVGYDEAERILETESSHGEIHQYFSVPPEEHRALIEARSPDQHLALAINKLYICKKVA